MTQKATVLQRLENGRARVEVRRQSACGGNCAHCASKCSEALSRLVVEAEDPLGAEPGQQVELYSETKKVLSAAALVYLLPVVLFLAAVLVTAGLELKSGLCALISVAAFLVGVAVAVAVGKRVGKSGTISHKIVKILK